MIDRRPTIALATQLATFAAAAAVVVFLVLQHRASTEQLAAIQAELYDANHARYEYKVVTVTGEGLDRKGADAMRPVSLAPEEQALTALGSSGWEVVSSYVELETAYPNFGDDKYVTGLQPNVRSQRLVIVLRRRVV